MTRSTKAGKLFDIANWSDQAKATIYGEIRHRSDIAAPVERRHFRFWWLLIVVILALAVVAAVY
jgi:hypothetical protein